MHPLRIHSAGVPLPPLPPPTPYPVPLAFTTMLESARDSFDNAPMKTYRHLAAIALALTGFALLAGCFQPDYPKVVSKLSDENFALEKDVATLKQQVKDKDATIAQQRELLDKRLPRVATLEPARLNEMITMARVQLRRAATWDLNGDGKLSGFRVYVRPVSEDGAALPATGTLTVEAFDLAKQGTQKLGKWMFTPAQLKKCWYAGFGLDQFAVDCKWEAPAEHSELVFKIEFVDALTGNVFTDQQTVNVQTPATRP